MKKLMFALCLLLALPAAAQNTNSSAKEVADQPLTVVYDGYVTQLSVAPAFKKQGFEKYWKWIISHVQYPSEIEKQKVEGTVRVRIVVGIDGVVTPGEVLESPSEALTAAVLRVIASAPKWTPGRILDPVSGHEVPVAVSYVLPVEFAARPQILHGSVSDQWKPQKNVRTYGSN